MSKIRFHWTRVFKILSAALLIIVLISIALNLITRSGKKTEVPRLSTELDQQKVKIQEEIEHFEAEGQKENFQIKADKHYVGEDDLYHLEGNVEIIFLKKREGKDVFIYGDEIVYDKELNHFVLYGKGRVKFKDLTVESSRLEYDKEKDIFKSNRGVSFSSKQLSGSARKMIYSVPQEKVELEGKIIVELIPNLETSIPLVIQGKKFTHVRRKKMGIVEGEVTLFHGMSHSNADYLEFELFDNEENVKSVFLRGNVHAQLIVEEGKKSERVIRAERIKIDAVHNQPKIRSIEAEGDCHFKSISPSGDFTQIESESIKFDLNNMGELKKLHAQEKVIMTEYKTSTDSQRIIEGDLLTLEGAENVLTVHAEQEFKARITTQESEVLTRELIVFLGTNDLEAKGGVKVILRPPETDETSFGFFSKQEPIFITAQEMRYSAEQKRFLFKETIRMWQQKKTLIANQAGLNEETGAILCSGGVATIVPYKSDKRGEEARMEISSDWMSFDPGNNLLIYEENSSLKVADIDLKAQTVSVHLEQEEGEMNVITAKGNVVVVQNQYEGQGNDAEYEIDRDAIVLTGNPVLIDKDKGKTAGDKLTFYISDAKIVVENKGRERSITVIK